MARSEPKGPVARATTEFDRWDEGASDARAHRRRLDAEHGETGETGETVGRVDLAALHRVADDRSEVGSRALAPYGRIGERVRKEPIVMKDASEHPRRGLILVPAERSHAR